MIRLPDDLEREFLAAFYEIEETKKLAYITSAERFGIDKGRLEVEATILLRQIERK